MKRYKEKDGKIYARITYTNPAGKQRTDVDFQKATHPEGHRVEAMAPRGWDTRQ